jgi:hypothetical protein
MNTYNTFFGFHALSNTPMRLDSEENNRINKDEHIMIFQSDRRYQFDFFYLIVFLLITIAAILS